MFRGSKTLSMDNKGRISMPTCYRDALIPLVLVPSPIPDEPCLLIYPLAAWKKVEDSITALPNTKANRKIKRVFVGQAEDAMLDSNGRLLIKSEFRKFANLDKKAFLVGQGDKLQLWDEATWDAVNADDDDDDAYLEAVEALVY